MKGLRPVVWAKGTFLTPQHLQVQDAYLESLLDFRLRSLGFRPWGFSELSIDQEAVSAGVLKVNRMAGLMPDGLAFQVPESDPEPEPRAFSDLFGPEQRTMQLFLAIPSLREEGVNVLMGSSVAACRYRADLANIRDENTGRSEKSILLGCKNFRILTESESMEGYTTLRLAKVLLRPDETFELSHDFVPPLVKISESGYLLSVGRRLVEILSAKSTNLALLRRQRNQSLADFSSADVANFWLLYTVNSFLPWLRHIVEKKRGHPEDLFETMTALAGSLTTFSRDIAVGDLPTYDHDDLGSCFSVLDERVRTLLETVVPSNVVSLSLKNVRPSIYAASVAEDRYLQEGKMYLAVNAEVKQAYLIERVPHLIKVCSAEHIDHLVRQALPGVALSHVTTPPSSIPVKLNFQYFRLNQSGGAWEAVIRARNLAAYIPSDFPRPNAELIILLPETR